MTMHETLAQRYIDCWNATDPQRRRALLGTWWTEEAHYRDPLAQVQGTAQIDSLIAAVQQRFPGLRFAWQLGPEHGDSLVEGTDFAELEAGRLARVTGFLDKLPAA
jgi:hypothetical protein